MADITTSTYDLNYGKGVLGNRNFFRLMTDADQDRLWREEYRNRRYLERASDVLLKQRLVDLLDNICAYDNRGILVARPNGEQVRRVLTHVLEEALLRGLQLNVEWEAGHHFNGKAYKNVKRAAELWARPLQRGTYLLKYGLKKYILPVMERGVFRLAPATSTMIRH